MSARKQRPERRSPASTAEATARLAEIVEAAERAASKVIDDAELEARRLVEEAGERADRIVAERLRELADRLDPAAPGEDREPPPLRHLEPVAIAEEEDEPRPLRSGAAGARLLATQMAVSGAERAEIEARLRSGFEIDDTGEILDAILGPEEEED
jgi:cell division septum initiation protein DivIVA